MSNLSMLPIRQLKDICGLNMMIETGAEAGYGIDTGLKAGVNTVYSCEILEGRFDKLIKKYETDCRVTLYHGSSKRMLPKMIEEIKGGSVFYWLDAHLPNCHDAANNYSIKEILPLTDEIEALKNSVDDVICIDDLCLFDHRFRHKDFDLQRWTHNKGERDMPVDKIRDIMPQHEWVIDTRQECVLIGIPKRYFSKCDYLYNMFKWVKV
jgi:hypothetical protein